MPGPKMGPRPPDFDEAVIRQSPTFIKWTQLATGEKLRYACREFIKDHGNDEERLMRRIMIARRNNLRDHEILKQARATNKQQQQPAAPESSSSSTEMDVPAVEKTRSYQAWQKLPDGATFVYNQKYTKGQSGHDWLLRKNIWRRMRYRRENKNMVERMKKPDPLGISLPVLPMSALDAAAQLAAAVVKNEGYKEELGMEGDKEKHSAEITEALIAHKTEAIEGIRPYDVEKEIVKPDLLSDDVVIDDVVVKPDSHSLIDGITMSQV